MSNTSKLSERARKLELRKQRNRASAAASRKRKDDRIDQLEAQVKLLLGENARLKLQAQMKQAMDQQQQSADPSLAAPMASSSFSSAGYGLHPLDSCSNSLPAVSAPYNG